MTAAPDVSVEFLGNAPAGDEVWGATQADFVIARPGHPRKECAVLLNDAAAAWLAEQAGRANTLFFRRQAARIVGQRLVEERLRRSGRVDSVLFVSRATIGDDASLLAAVRAIPPDPAGPADE